MGLCSTQEYMSKIGQKQLEKESQQAEAALLIKRDFFKASDQYLNMLMCNMKFYFQNLKALTKEQALLNIHSVIPAEDQDRKKYVPILQSMKTDHNYDIQKLNLSLTQSRSIGAILGMAIGDALGACTQFQKFNKEGLGIIKTGFKDIHAAIMTKKISSRSGKVGIWTDDASMGLCLADSILLTDYHFNPKHIRYLFTLWLENGLNNGGRDYSIGLGGNISLSMSQFKQKQQNYTEPGNRFNNGNGSLMRLAPIPVAFSDQPQKGIIFSGLQSLTTHNGVQSHECSRLMGKIIIQLINRKVEENGIELILKICDNFQSECQSVVFLAKGKKQSHQLFQKSQQNNSNFSMFNKSLADRNWNWREKDFSYSPSRLDNMPGYIGSYCMDALAMALHTVMYSDSFAQVVIKNADMGGDCDTVGSIAGQIAGALYGMDEKMLSLYGQMEDFLSGRYEVFLKAYKLATKKQLVYSQQKQNK